LQAEESRRIAELDAKARIAKDMAARVQKAAQQRASEAEQAEAKAKKAMEEAEQAEVQVFQAKAKAEARAAEERRLIQVEKQRQETLRKIAEEE